MTDTIKLLNERAASYGALRQSSLTAVAMDCAAVELAALEAELGERVQELAAAHATIHQLGENAAKAAAFDKLEAEMRRYVYDTDPKRRLWALDKFGGAALTEPTDEG